MPPQEIWIWQNIVSPHWAGLITRLAEQVSRVRLLVSETMSPDRMALGWSLPDTGRAQVLVASSADAMCAAAASAEPEVVHICQGVRANGFISHAQQVLREKGARQLVTFETIDDEGWRGPVKRLVYQRLFRRVMPSTDGVLAIGELTPDWLQAVGVPASKIFPFAYFINEADAAPVVERAMRARFRFLFVGQFVERKRLDLLIQAIADTGREDVELEVLGSGPLEGSLRQMAASLLKDRCIWTGVVPRAEVAGRIGDADCLVLPSRHDGWGAVVSEALLSGVPAICSEHCGTSGVVRGSGHGGVFPVDDRAALADLVEAMVAKGPLPFNERLSLAAWARCIGATFGADHVLAIMDEIWEGGPPATAPWEMANCRNMDMVQA